MQIQWSIGEYQSLGYYVYIERGGVRHGLFAAL